MGPMQKQIIDKLTNAFEFSLLDVENEGDKHSAGAAAEMHFKVIMVADCFAGKLKVARHRAIYSCLSDELKGQVHALALFLYTPEEWERLEQKPQTPDCISKR